MFHKFLWPNLNENLFYFILANSGRNSIGIKWESIELRPSVTDWARDRKDFAGLFYVNFLWWILKNVMNHDIIWFKIKVLKLFDEESRNLEWNDYYSEVEPWVTKLGWPDPFFYRLDSTRLNKSLGYQIFCQFQTIRDHIFLHLIRDLVFVNYFWVFGSWKIEFNDFK